MTLSAAVHAREVLRFDYPAGPAADAPHGLPPAAAGSSRTTWSPGAGAGTLVAWDLDRDDWRTFRVDRISPRTPTGPRFTPRELPGGDVAAYVAGRFHGAGGSGDWPCRGEVILDLPARTVSTWTRDGLVEELGPDRCRLVLGGWSWPGLAALLGRYDADIEVVGPPELRDAFARLARRYAAAAVGTRRPASP